MSISKEDLIRWLRVCDAATPGPWVVVDAKDDDGKPEPFVGMKRHRINCYWELDSTLLSQQDAEFIAMAREAIPRLIEEIKELQEAAESFSQADNQLSESIAWETKEATVVRKVVP